MLPASRLADVSVELLVLRPANVRPDAEEPLERGMEVAPAVEAEDVLIQVGLKMLRLDAPVVRPCEPCLQVAPRCFEWNARRVPSEALRSLAGWRPTSCSRQSWASRRLGG